MENKGQASAEYLLLLVVILIIIAAVTIPLAGSAVNNSMATSVTSDGVNAVQSIANAVNLVYGNGPGAKRTISVYIPQTTTLKNSTNTTISSGNYFVGMDLIVSGGPYNGPNVKTTSLIPPDNGRSINFVFANTDYPVNVNPSTSINKGWYKAVVYWNVGNTTIDVTLTPS
jgi:uncharacterized protein (UPF0333 family)